MSRKSATTRRPAIAAFHASASESLPSVAEIAVVSSVLKVTGRAPLWSTSARSFASVSEPMPVIWAPFEPPIPFGYCSKSIDGHDLIWRSSTIAKCWNELPGSPWPPVMLWRARPRSASRFVISPNLSPPLSVNCIVTIGSPVVVSKSCRVPASFRSAPVISGTTLFGSALSGS